MTEVDEIVQEVLVESHENLDQLGRGLVALEQEPGSRELLGSVFRTIHTIKGTSGFLAFGHLEAVTHVGENLLSKLRDGELALTREITSVLLEMVDAVRALLASIEAAGAEGDPDHAALITKLSALATGGPPSKPQTPGPSAEVAADVAGGPATDSADEPAPDPAVKRAPAGRRKRSTGSRRPAPKRAGAAAEEGTAATPKPDAANDRAGLLGELLVEQGQVRQEDVAIAVLEQGRRLPTPRGDPRRPGGRRRPGRQ